MKTPDFNRVYEPEQMAQLGKDLVAARKGKLDSFELHSLKRWERDGIAARIRRLPEGGLTCWPADLSTRTGQSYVNGRPASPRDAMAHLRGEKDFTNSFSVHFNKRDLDLLRAAAITDTGRDQLFQRAVYAVERDSYLIVQCMTAEEGKAMIARFADAGIARIEIHPLRTSETQPVRM